MEDFSEKTRRIYHEQHSRVAADARAMERFINMFSMDYFGLPADWFHGKKVLDGGCGNTGKLLIAMHRHGAEEIHGFDLGEEFIPEAQAVAQRYGVPVEKLHLQGASLLDIPYEDNTFDFVACHGVLIHLNTIEEASRAFSELARIVKPNGYLYTVFGVVGGLLEGALYPAIREYYNRNPDFRSFVDTLAPEKFGSILAAIQNGIKQHEQETIDLSRFGELLDRDLCVTIQNIIQAPVRLEIDEARVRNLYADHGCQDVRRLKRYIRRKNIRRFCAPLHYERGSEISRILYGSGNLDFIGRKSVAAG